jgi:exopolyphosphatase/guanosine-5'-triphosphate,3'-diphosphate pyrophosphatase
VDTIRRAVIDVGTNSIKLLVADISAQEVRPVWEGSKQTRLGKGFYQTHELQPGAISQTARAVAEFASAARKHQSKSIRIIATSAVREAINSNQLTDAIETGTGLKVEILSGEQEADLVFQGVTTDPALRNEPLLLLDVGGGSTEFILGHAQHQDYSKSIALGSVRLLETHPPGNPPRVEELSSCRKEVKQLIRKHVCPDLEPLLFKARKENQTVLHLVGTGGTATILARMESNLANYDRERIESTRLSCKRLLWHVEHLWSLPFEKRKDIVGLPSNRADVILGGILIYEAVMNLFEFNELRITTRGLRFAALLT